MSFGNWISLFSFLVSTYLTIYSLRNGKKASIENKKIASDFIVLQEKQNDILRQIRNQNQDKEIIKILQSYGDSFLENFDKIYNKIS